MSEAKRRLLVGYKAADLRPDLLDGDVTVHELDIYHAHAVEKTHPGAKVVCTPHLPEGPWDEILFRTGPKLMSGELSLDLLQEIARLAGGDLRAPQFQLDFVGRERDRNDLLAKVKDDPKRVRNFSSVWPASVPGGPKLMFTSFPGCFCHRRLDEGGLALAEVVAHELTARGRETEDGRQGADDSRQPELRLLDMGCGCGLVGLLVGSVVKGLKLTLIDSHTRAVEAAELNAKAFGADACVVLADDGLDSVQSPDSQLSNCQLTNSQSNKFSIEQSNNSSFDVFVGNPPYYSDYRIADVFLQTAKKALRTGGVCYTVVKNDAGLKPVQERYFPSVAVIRRRGYCVLKSVKGCE